MEASQSGLSSDQRNRRDLILGAQTERRALEENLFEALSRASNLDRESSDQRIGIVPEDSAGLRPVEASDQASPPRRTRFKTDPFANNRPSLRRRMSRRLIRFFIVALIGASVTLAWQSYGEQAKEVVRARVPSLAWLLPVSTTKSLPEGQAMFAATVSQQLKPMAIDLAVMRRSVEDLATQQNQMAQSLAAMQTVEQDLRQKISSLPSARAVPLPLRAPRVAVPQPTTTASQPPARVIPLPPRNNVPTAADSEPSAPSSSVR